jgi:hypothetical protein
VPRIEMDLGEPRGETAGRPRREAPVDLWVIAAWWVVVVALGFLRWDYTGDGLRHLPPIVDGGGPRLGEPRWILFPGMLWALLRPFVVLGIAPTVQGLARVMTGATVLAAGAYMLALRACLAAAGIDSRRRAAALALAGLSAGLFLPSTDLMEPIFGATLVMVALGWAARRVARLDASEADRRRALLVTVAAIAVAALLYQGLVLALGLLPLVFPRETLRDRRAQLQAALILAAIPLVMVGPLVLGGDSLQRALGRALQGEENPLYRSYLKKTGPFARVTATIVALVGGPPQGLVQVGDFHGFNGLIAGLRGGEGRSQALGILGRFAFGGGIILAGVIAAIRRRDRAVLIAFTVLMILPLVRSQQYGYIKYYIFLPVVVAFAAGRARPGLVGLLAAVLVWLHVVSWVRALPGEHRDYREHAAVYEQAGAQGCFFTPAWAPPYSFLWPGRVCGVLTALASGHGDTDAQVIAGAHARMTAALDACFCESSGVYADDLTESLRPQLAESARQFRYTSFDLGELVLPEGRASRVSPPDVLRPLYRYPPDDQRRICESVKRAQRIQP